MDCPSLPVKRTGPAEPLRSPHSGTGAARLLPTTPIRPRRLAAALAAAACVLIAAPAAAGDPAIVVTELPPPRNCSIERPCPAHQALRPARKPGWPAVFGSAEESSRQMAIDQAEAEQALQFELLQDRARKMTRRLEDALAVPGVQPKGGVP